MPVHCKESIPKMRNKYSQKRICAATVPVSTFMCLWAMIDLPILLQGLCGPILGIYKSLTDIWMWKLRLRPTNSQIHTWDFRCSVCMHGSVYYIKFGKPEVCVHDSKTLDSLNASVCLEYLYTIGGTSQSCAFHILSDFFIVVTFDLVFFRVYCAFLKPRGYLLLWGKTPWLCQLGQNFQNPQPWACFWVKL